VRPGAVGWRQLWAAAWPVRGAQQVRARQVRAQQEWAQQVGAAVRVGVAGAVGWPAVWVAAWALQQALRQRDWDATAQRVFSVLLLESVHRDRK